MHSLSPEAKTHRNSARRNVKPVVFICHAPQAQRVSVIGEFNQWNPGRHVMKRQSDGAWRIEIPLSHGYHQYAFVVDGQRLLDPRGYGVARDAQNEPVSLIAVS